MQSLKELKYINVELTKEFPVLYGHGEMVNLKKIKNYQQLLNISDTQNYCFIYAIAAYFKRHQTTKPTHASENVYKMFIQTLNLSDMSFPCEFHDIRYFIVYIFVVKKNFKITYLFS